MPPLLCAAMMLLASSPLAPAQPITWTRAPTEDTDPATGLPLGSATGKGTMDFGNGASVSLSCGVAGPGANGDGIVFIPVVGCSRAKNASGQWANQFDLQLPGTVGGKLANGDYTCWMLMATTPPGGAASFVISDLKTFTVTGGVAPAARRTAVTCTPASPQNKRLSASGTWTVANPGTYDAQTQQRTVPGDKVTNIAFYAFTPGGGYLLVANSVTTNPAASNGSSGTWSYGPTTVVEGQWKAFAILAVERTDNSQNDQMISNGFSSVTVSP